MPKMQAHTGFVGRSPERDLGTVEGFLPSFVAPCRPIRRDADGGVGVLEFKRHLCFPGHRHANHLATQGIGGVNLGGRLNCGPWAN